MKPTATSIVPVACCFTFLMLYFYAEQEFFAGFIPAAFRQGQILNFNKSQDFTWNFLNSSSVNGTEKNVTLISNQSSLAFVNITNLNCTPTMYVRCDSNVSNEFITNETFGISLQRRPFWINAELFFNFSKCQYSNCFFQNDQINESTRMVIVEIVGMNDRFKPVHRWPHQLYVATVWEPPFFIGSYSLNDRNSYWNTRFNLTASYRTDSDIFVPYGSLEFKPKSFVERPNYYDIARNKTKWVLWYVSKCRAPSLRDMYVKEMQKVIDVDIYGRCGKRCPDKGYECSEDFFNQYRFYLSFENSLCKDYVTEKLLNQFINTRFTVPVVRGGFDYDKYFPNHTFINTAHFTNATHLAQFLKQLGEDPATYSKYLEHKDKYRLTEDSGLSKLGCEACKYLHTKNLEGNISDLKNFLIDDKCQEPKDI